MSATAEAVTEAAKKATKKAVKKTPKKATGTAAAKPRAKKLIAAKKAAKAAPKKTVADKPARAKKAAPATKRGRPAGKKTVSKRRVKKEAKRFAYLLLTPQEDGTQKASTMNGPFSTEGAALDDASLMSEENVTIVLFRETKRGTVQRQTKFVAGR